MDLISLFGLNGPLFVAQLVNFLIVLFVLHRFVYKPLLAAMDARAEKVREGLIKAEAAESVLNDAHKKAARTVRQAELEAQALLDRTRAEADVKRQELLHASHQELERQVETVRQQIQEERASMIQGAKKELAELVMKATDRVTRDVLQDAEQRTVLTESVKEVLS